MMLESAEMTKNTFQAQKLGLGAMKAVQKDLCVPPSVALPRVFKRNHSVPFMLCARGKRLRRAKLAPTSVKNEKYVTVIVGSWRTRRAGMLTRLATCKRTCENKWMT